MPGRKPVPTNLKLLKGSFRRDRAVENEARPNPNIPSAPDHLSKHALIEWGRISEKLYKLGLLTDIDRAALAMYCQAWGRHVDAELSIKDKGMTIKTTNGNIIQNPMLGISNRAYELASKMITEFGMTPSARTRINVTPPKEEDNPFENLKNRAI